jgi:hypothetical protein
VGGLIARVRRHPRRVLLGLVVAHVVLKLALYPRTMNAVPVGDETYYLDAGRAFSNLIRDVVAFRPIDTAELARNGVGNGWFMPGMGLVLTPLFVVVPAASQAVVHGYLGVVTTLLLLVVVARTRTVLGARYAAAVLVFPGLVPMWLIFSYCAWGDLLAGILALLLVTQLVTAWRALRDGTPPTLRQGACHGLVAIAVVYARGSALILSAGLLTVLGIGVLALLRGGRRLRGLTALALTAVVFAAILAPWSVAVSRAMHGPVLTTTSTPTVLGNTFGDPTELCFGPCDPHSSRWYAPLRYGREVAREAGIGEVEALGMMSDHALRDVTPHSYAADVLANAGRYVAEPHRFARFVKSPGVAPQDRVEELWRAGTELMWWPMLVLALAGLLSTYRRPFEDQLVSLLTKLGIGALLMQPFVHICGARYWTTAAPLFALSAVLWLSHRGVADGVDGVDGAEDARRSLSTWLHRAQVLLVGAAVAIAAGVVVLASV